MCDGVGNTKSLRRLMGDIAEFVATPVEATPAEFGERLVELRHGIDRLELQFAREAAVFAATDEYAVQGSTSPIDWVRHQCFMSIGAAARAVTTGEQVDRLPASVAALEAGRIGFAHLSLFAGTARAIEASGTQTGFDEGPLLALAEEHSVSRFARDCTQARHAADAAAVLAEHVGLVESRRLELTRCEDGRIVIRGLLDPVGGAALRLALAPLTAPKGADDDRSRKRRSADALVELAMHTLDHGFATERGTTRPHLQLTASVETVLGMPGAPGGDLEFAGAVPAATVQRLARDASVRRVLLGPDSAVIDVGRALRVPSGAARAALRVRDGGCVWPGCDRPASWTNAHHVLHWGHGGVTDLDNLVLLCHRHHWSVHEGGWQLVRAEGQRVLAVPPAHPYRSWPRAPDGVGAG